MINFKEELRKPNVEAEQFKDLHAPTKAELNEIWNELGLKNPK